MPKTWVTLSLGYRPIPSDISSPSKDRPHASEIASLNVWRTNGVDLSPLSRDDVFRYFLRRLRSEEAFLRIFSEVILPSPDEENGVRRRLG